MTIWAKNFGELCRQKDLYTYKKVSGKGTFRKTLNCNLELVKLCFGLLLGKFLMLSGR